MEILTNNQLITIYYNRRYRVDASLFSKHLIGHLGFIFDKTKSIPLKTVIVDGKVITEIIAELVLPMKIRDSDLLL